MSLSQPKPEVLDPAMPALAAALDLEAMGPRLQRALQEGRSEWSSLRLAGVRLVRHKPGRRALIEYRLATEPTIRLVTAGSERVEALTVLGKMRAKGLDRRTPVVMAGLSRAGFGPDSADGVSVPAVLGSVPELGLWLQQAVPGCGLGEWPTSRAGVFLAGRVAHALHKLHRTSVPTTRRHSVDDELGILAERFARLTSERPELAARLHWLQAACVELAGSLRGRPVCGIHRDFYPAQILAGGDRLWLLDFDLYCEGDPALDVGNFLAHLSEQALRTHGRAQALAESEQAFAVRYLELSGERSFAAIEAWHTLALARHVSISHQFPERRAVTELLLAWCERRLRYARSTPRATPTAMAGDPTRP